MRWLHPNKDNCNTLDPGPSYTNPQLMVMGDLFNFSDPPFPLLKNRVLMWIKLDMSKGIWLVVLPWEFQKIGGDCTDGKGVERVFQATELV